MTNQSQAPASADQKSRRFQIGLTLFLIGLLVAFFLLGNSMVNHRFFRGGRIDRYGHVKQ
ncbi:MAG: hypothetical protein ABSF16_01785 [Terracidiphilus sp.]|jgi:hypothetical protein